jgi:para-nitrobenzyl esterase
VAVLLAACATGLDKATQTQIGTHSGVVEGAVADGVTSYLGIPFAAPPVADLRWRPPQPVAPWEGVRQATAFAPACMQVGVSMPGEAPPRTSEDCLYLNVWAPVAKGAERLPVIVWIHGGGWMNGATAMPLYSGERLARRGVVFVSIAYRLGPLGFLAHPELSAESGAGASGNYGVMDQIAALTWVRDNIAAFGGDPARVTIAGQSAGAMSVSLLMTSPQGAGLFQRAIGQSGGVFEPLQLAPSYLLANAEKDGVDYATSVGASSLAELRALPADRLLGGRAGSVSHPVIEPRVLPRSPYEAYVAGKWNDVPVLVGSNAEEGNSLADLAPVTAANFGSELKRIWGDLPPPLTTAYPYATDDEAKRARSAFERDLRFGWDMWAWARLQALFGASPAFFYRFDHAPPFPRGSVREPWGAGHYAELWYMFDNLLPEDAAWTAADRMLADRMASYWVNFAQTGDPNGEDLPLWPQFSREAGETMVLGTDVRIAESPVDLQLRVFDGVYDAVRGKPFGTP